jgi:hypothetical protein
MPSAISMWRMGDGVEASGASYDQRGGHGGMSCTAGSLPSDDTLLDDLAEVGTDFSRGRCLQLNAAIARRSQVGIQA